MRKYILILVSIFSLILVGCGGSKNFKPGAEGEYNTVYRNTTNKELDGQYPVINVASIEKGEDKIIVNINAPTLEQLEYAVSKFLYLQPIDSLGGVLDFVDYKLEAVQDGTIEAKLNISGIKTDEVKWLEIGPYKINDKDSLIFKVE